MRRKLSLFWISTLILTGCGPGESNNASDRTYNSTPGISNNVTDTGAHYVSTDSRVETALTDEEEAQAPAAPAAPGSHVVAKPTAPPAVKRQAAPNTVATKSLFKRIKEYEISRYAEGAKDPSRSGDRRIKITIFFNDENPVVFDQVVTGKEGHYDFDKTSGNYNLKGTFIDTFSQGMPKALIKTDGDLWMTDSLHHETVHVLYQAYKAGLTVREDREKKLAANSPLQKQLDSLRENTFGWVNNWTLVHNKSFKAFYLVDIIKIVGNDDETASFPTPVFAFKGESLQTDDEVHSADSLTPQFAKDVKLVGNGEKTGLRVFSAEIADPDSKENYEFMIDLKEQKNQTPAGTPDNNEPNTDDSEDSTSEYGATPDNSAATSQAPTADNSGAAKPKFKSPSILGTSYLKINTALPRTARMVRDFSRNRSLDGVKNWIAYYRSNTTLGNFFFYAYPLRHLLEAIGETFDVAPTYAYLTVIESEYLTGGRYNNRQIGDSGKAYGPFQMHPEAASENGVLVTKRSNDERYYFAPAACGAARYMVALVDKFKGSDTTLAILGYNQGATGAMRLASRFGYTYRRMSESSSGGKKIREYVDKKLAIYFISSNMINFGYNPNLFANKTPPPQKTILPPSPIYDPTCRATVSAAMSGAN